MNHPAKFFILSLLLCFTCAVNAQYFPSKNYPKNYFRNPLGIPIQLSGNFGELRTDHFHMGLDMRTNQKENLPVYAAADGYVSKIIIERYGYGRAILITHPNGYTTLYAHLNDFYKELNDHVKSIQYRDEIWEHEFTLPPGLFPVSKGQFIAYSGNTGGSEGPHLHFEIRNTKTDKNLNPLLFNFDIPDKIPPLVDGFYWYDRRVNIYQTSPKKISIKGSNGNYKTVDSVITVASPTFSFGISAEDKTDNSFKFGIYQTELWVDDSLRCAFQLDNILYKDSRYMNGCIDYKTKYSGGPYIQHLSRLPGNESTIFFKDNDGVITINDTLVHTAEVFVKDVAGNTSSINFKIRLNTSFSTEEIIEGYKMIPNKSNILQKENYVVIFREHAFYDTVLLQPSMVQPASARGVSEQFQIHNYKIPVHDSFTVTLKQTKALGIIAREKIVTQLISNKKFVASKGAWQSDWMISKFWDLGRVQLILDTIPPTLTPLGWKNNSNLRNAKSITFLVEDDAGGVKDFRAELDGNWLMFSRKNNFFIHQFDERTVPGAHELKVFVTDVAGNVIERVYCFIK